MNVLKLVTNIVIAIRSATTSIKRYHAASTYISLWKSARIDKSNLYLKLLTKEGLCLWNVSAVSAMKKLVSCKNPGCSTTFLDGNSPPLGIDYLKKTDNSKTSNISRRLFPNFKCSEIITSATAADQGYDNTGNHIGRYAHLNLFLFICVVSLPSSSFHSSYWFNSFILSTGRISFQCEVIFCYLSLI